MLHLKFKNKASPASKCKFKAISHNQVMFFLFPTSSLIRMILWSKWTEGVCLHDGCGNLEESLLLSDYNADTSKILFVSVKIRAAVKAGRHSA